MTIVYVDVEHHRVTGDPERGPIHATKLEAARSRIAGFAESTCVVVCAEGITPERVEEFAPSAIVVSAATADWAEYDFASLNGLFEIVRTATVPILGICAGHQLIGYAHGASWGPLGPLQEGETDSDPRFVPGRRKERGFMPLDIDPDCALFRGLSHHPVFFQSHYWHLHEVPPGFVARARSAWSPIQAIECLDRPVFGVQFHAERTTSEHPDGDMILRNFLDIARG